MIWKDKLEQAVKLDGDTDPKAIKNFISEANEVLCLLYTSRCV